MTIYAPATPAIHAVGERASSITARYSVWSRRSGNRPGICGARLAGDDAAVYVPQPAFTSLKITGIDVFSAGVLVASDEDDNEITLHDGAHGLYKKLILRGDRVVGSVLYGPCRRRFLVC